MRLLSIVSLLLFACTTEAVRTVKFEHQLFNLEYPDNWVIHEKEGMILAISKFSELKAIIQVENPNLVAASSDSVYLLDYGIYSLQEFLGAFKQDRLELDNVSLEEDINSVTINGTEVQLIKYKVRGEYLTFLQSQYSFTSMGQYVAIMLTHEYDKPNSELTAIIKSLEINKSSRKYRNFISSYWINTCCTNELFG